MRRPLPRNACKPKDCAVVFTEGAKDTLKWPYLDEFLLPDLVRARSAGPQQHLT
jgi:hypothetical protein